MNYVDRTAAPYAFLPYGLGLPNVKIRLIGATTSSPWPSVIERARNAWNNAGTKVNITTTTSGSSPYTLEVKYLPEKDWAGNTRSTVVGGVTVAAKIEINSYKLPAKSSDYRSGVVVHEIGHLLGLKDNPYMFPDLNIYASVMSYDADLNIVFVPQMADIFHVRTKYK